MKIHAVVYNVDLGYHVEYASISQDKAQKVLDAKIKQKYDYAVNQQMLRGFDCERAKENVGKCFWHGYELIEIEVVE